MGKRQKLEKKTNITPKRAKYKLLLLARNEEINKKNEIVRKKFGRLCKYAYVVFGTYDISSFDREKYPLLSKYLDDVWTDRSADDLKNILDSCMCIGWNAGGKGFKAESIVCPICRHHVCNSFFYTTPASIRAKKVHVLCAEWAQDHLNNH